MPDQRISFSKTGRARYISHLDLMRTFQRAFLRAEVPIRHTEGFNPHAYVSIPLPLSVGYSSECEIMEFGLMGEMPLGEVPWRLTRTLPEGITVHRCYDAARPFKELCYVNYIITLDTNIYSPILDIAQDPRWGRVVECYGEDPFCLLYTSMYTSNRTEVYLRGEEGAISTPPRIQMIYDQIKSTGKTG